MAFVRKDVTAPDQSFCVGVTMGKKSLTKGVVGLEIEVEGNKFPKPEHADGTHDPTPMPDMKFWSYVDDGSLRGKENGGDDAEYILTKPISFDEVPTALDEIYSGLKTFGSKIDSSHRTSVHVHLNVQPFFLNRLTSLMAIYITLEEVLTEWCGEHRVGNLFCLRAKDAPAIVSQLRRFIRANMEAPIKDYHRYAGMNANSIRKLGSLEFRALRGVPEPSVIQQWVDILHRIYDLSEAFPDPRDICGEFSGHGPVDFFEKMLGEHAAVVRNGIGWDDDQIAASMYEGIRLAQDLCYCRDWTIFKGVDLKSDPFGRDLKTILRKLTGQGQQAAYVDQAMQTLEEVSPSSLAQAAYAAITSLPPGGLYAYGHPVQAEPDWTVAQPVYDDPEDYFE